MQKNKKPTSEIKERLIRFLKVKGIGQATFSRIVGLSKGFVNNVGDSIRANSRRHILDAYPDLNEAWLVHGIGPMLKEQEEPAHVLKENQSLYTISELADLTHGEPDKLLAPLKGLDVAVTMSDDSMGREYPRGSVVYAKKVDMNAFIEWGHVYVLETPNGLIVKEIRKASTNDYVLCLSLHEDQEKFAPYELAKSNILNIYKVVLTLK